MFSSEQIEKHLMILLNPSQTQENTKLVTSPTGLVRFHHFRQPEVYMCQLLLGSLDHEIHGNPTCDALRSCR